MTSFDLENVDLRSQNLRQKDCLCLPPSVVSLALLGAEIAGGHYMPPSRACKSQTLSSARVHGLDLIITIKFKLSGILGDR